MEIFLSNFCKVLTEFLIELPLPEGYESHFEELTDYPELIIKYNHMSVLLRFDQQVKSISLYKYPTKRPTIPYNI